MFHSLNLWNNLWDIFYIFLISFSTVIVKIKMFSSIPQKLYFFTYKTSEMTNSSALWFYDG